VSRLEREELPQERLGGAQKGAQSMGVLGVAMSSEGGMTAGTTE